MTRRFTHIVLLVVVLTVAALTACSDKDDVDPAYTHYLLDLVTYDGPVDAQGGSRFTLVGRDDAPSTALTAAQSVVASDVKPGTRMLLRYTPVSGAVGGAMHVTAHAATPVIGDVLRAAWRSGGDWTQHPVRLRSLWRTGGYINIHCQVEYTGKARRVALVVDSATIAADTVHCYLVHNLLDAQPMQWRECYVSIDVHALWQRPSCQVMRLHIADEVNPERTTHDIAKSQH
jgi:hypothetical protein